VQVFSVFKENWIANHALFVTR